MIFTDLFEGISDILFHRTGFSNVVSILENNEFKLRPTFAKPIEQEYAKKKTDLYFISTARTKNSKYISDSSSPIITLDGRKLKQNYSGYGMDYFGPRWREAGGGEYEQEDRIFSQTPTIPNAKKYILMIELVMNNTGSNQAASIFKIYGMAKKSGIPIKFYGSIQDRAISKNPLSETQVREELKKRLDDLKKNSPHRPYTPPRRPMYEGNAVPAIFLGLKFDPEDNIPADVETRIDRFLRKWPGMDKQTVRVDFHNAVSDEKYRNLMTQIVAFMKKNNLRTIDDLGEFVYQKWIDR